VSRGQGRTSEEGREEENRDGMSRMLCDAREWAYTALIGSDRGYIVPAVE